ncbi:General transcription factor 3C polypeptide 6 [Aix galericulata]|nr:General transcription factor 3C polypeptide 6 [Aix galericulata]
MAAVEGVEGGERKEEDEEEVEGIETERPILQVDRYVFAGEYEDALGTCVVFEENTEHVDAEGNQKVQLKYKCHTMKKLNMTRTLLTEKKEGEENVDGVEWLQIKDRDFSYSRPNTICSFLHEKEDSDESAQAPDKLAEESEGEASDKGNSDTNCDQAQDKLAEESEGEASDRGNSDTNCDLENEHGLETDASFPLPHSPASEAEGSTSARGSSRRRAEAACSRALDVTR